MMKWKLLRGGFEMTHMHITTWLVAIILFFVAFTMYKKGNAKQAKILHMITRLFYILIIVTGGMLMGSQVGYYMWKMIVGLIVIAMMEMVLVKTKKGKGTGVYWVLFIVSFVVVLYLGLKLPQGFHPFL